MAEQTPTGASGEQAKAQQESKAGQTARRQAGEPRERQAGASEGRRLSRATFREPTISGMWSMSPFSLMRRMMEDLDRVFEEFGGGRALAPSGEARRGMAAPGGFLWVPQVDVLEREGRFLVRADLPGMSKDDIRLELTEDALVLEGERRQEQEAQGEGFYRSERSHGSFRRVVPLPEGVDPDRAEARFENGVLEVTLPLEESRTRRRRIEIQEGKQGSVH